MTGRRLRRRQDRKGIALLLVVAAVVTMTVLVTDVTFGSRVRFVAAAHEQQRTQAYYLARSGISIYRLILTANRQLARNSSIKPFLEQMGIPPGDALWRAIPFLNTGLLRMMLVADGGDLEEEEVRSFAEEGAVSEAVAEQSRETGGSRFGGRNFLDFDGDFAVEARGEDCGINVNLFSSKGSDKLPQDTEVGKMLYGLMSGEENEDFLRERNLDRWELIGNLADWVDADNVVSSGRGGYEDEFYNRQEPPYLAKNAPFDTLQEIRLVEGWQDDVYARFAPSLTIYGAGKVNLNCASDEVMKGLLMQYAGVTTDAQADQVLQLYREAQAVTVFSRPQDFVTWLSGLGYTVDPALANVLSVSTTYFTLTSTGQVGDATVRITAAFEYKNDRGKLLYWRVD